MSTSKEQPESASSAETSPNKPEYKIIEPGMASGSCSGFAMPTSIVRSA